MRKSVIQALSVAMAAAMVLSVAPAVPTEAASKTATYLVTKKTDEDGGVTTYKYDKKGRVVKETYKLTSDYVSSSEVKVNGDDSTDGTTPEDPTVTTNDDGSKKASFDYTTTTTYTVGTETTSTVSTIEAVTTYTYNKKGYGKGQKATATTTTTTTKACNVAVASDDSEYNTNNSYSYATVESDLTMTTYDYNKKGQCVTETNITQDTKPVYVSASGKTYGSDYSKIMERSNANNKDDVTYTTVTKTNTYNKKGMNTKKNVAISSKVTDKTVNFDSDLNVTGSKVVESDATSLGFEVAIKYNKSGRPTKKTTTDNSGATAATYVTKTYNASGSLINTVKGTQDLTIESMDSSSTTYKYDKSGNLVKAINDNSGSTFAYKVEKVGVKGYTTYTVDTSTRSTTYTGGESEVTNSYDGITLTSAYTSGNVVKYEYTTKGDTNRITSRTSVSTKNTSNGVDNGRTSTSRTTYKVKKVKVPTSNLVDVEKEQWALTNGF
ncbi:MAG: hypothetical protein K6F30_01580 [Lachnospiraceae bacterium]|nr:hypothetical protein [Lachnospiraceae bacterium]